MSYAVNPWENPLEALEARERELMQMGREAGGGGSAPPEESDLIRAGYRPADTSGVIYPVQLQYLSTISVSGSESERATRVVEIYQRELERNLSLYQNGGQSPEAAISYFDAAFRQMEQQLSQLGEAGKRAILERDRTAGGGQGVRWDWIAYYRDPIAQAAGLKSGNTANGSSLSYGPIIILGAVILVLLLLWKGRG